MPRNSICLLDLLVCFCNDRTAKGDLLIICMCQDWLVVLLFSGEFIQFRLQKDVIWNVLQGIAGATPVGVQFHQASHLIVLYKCVTSDEVTVVTAGSVE